MSITAKELAKKLELSETAVSMALNNKSGVSAKTKNKVLHAAEKYGYDFSRIASKNNKNGCIYAVWYRGSNAIISYSPIFDEILDGIEKECRGQGYKVRIVLRGSDCIGVILLGTELTESASKV